MDLVIDKARQVRWDERTDVIDILGTAADDARNAVEIMADPSRFRVVEPVMGWGIFTHLIVSWGGRWAYLVREEA